MQLIKISDISKPAAASATYESSKGSSGGGGGGKRVLLLQATDGTQKVVVVAWLRQGHFVAQVSCLEVDRVDALSVGLPPGKVLVRTSSVSYQIGTKILLDGSTEVLNGQVLLRPDKVTDPSRHLHSLIPYSVGQSCRRNGRAPSRSMEGQQAGR